MSVFAQLHHRRRRRRLTPFLSVREEIEPVHAVSSARVNKAAMMEGLRRARGRGEGPGQRSSRSQNLLLPAWVSGSHHQLIKDHISDVAGALPARVCSETFI